MVKELIFDFREIKRSFKEMISYRRYSLKLRTAINLAKIKQRAFNRQCYVVALELPDRRLRLRVINTKEFAALKRKKWLPKHMSSIELKKQSFYYTPGSANNSMTREEQNEARKETVN